MGNAHWWLIALAFVLGLVLTFALMVRRVKREVPVSTSTAATSAGAATSLAGARSGTQSEPTTTKTSTATEKASTRKMPAETDAPYGTGSARAGADGSGPSGWPVKGNEDSMLYHTPDSPSYDQTIAEVWFQDEESAVRAGFTPWHEGERKK